MRITPTEIKKLSFEDLLSRNKYTVSEEPHIKVNTKICDTCPHHACVMGCPCGCYVVEEGRLVFSYEGCLECGTCRVICDRGAVDWNYPPGGFGVQYRFG